MLQSIKNKLQTYLDVIIPQQIDNNVQFSERIKNRHKIFWKALYAERVRNKTMLATDSMRKWKNVKNWQRKLSNKFNSREFAKKHGCKVAELYWKGRNCNSIDFDNLPDQYVIRPTMGHSLGLVFLINNSTNLMDGKRYSKEDIRQVLAKALYENEKLEFLIEEFLKTEDGMYQIPADYKFYMFNGQIASIQVINRLNSSEASNSWYDENWNPMMNLTSNYSRGTVQKSPECLTEMIEYARKLSKAYEIFVRIDFYATDKGAVFGEFTPTPAFGKGFTPAGDKLLADYWDRFCKGKV